jgi:hypothetical protein
MSSDSENEKRAGGALPPTEHNEVESSELPVVIDKATERRLMRKLDSRIVWVVMWTYLMNFMDRVNIGNARLYGLEEDLGLTGNQFQISVSILYVFPLCTTWERRTALLTRLTSFVTYCIFEAPSNMIIKRFQPARYIGGLCIAWGMVATFSAWVENFAGLVACRLLLGFFEAGMVFPYTSRHSFLGSPHGRILSGHHLIPEHVLHERAYSSSCRLFLLHVGTYAMVSAGCEVRSAKCLGPIDLCWINQTLGHSLDTDI